jgi:hypothetical protein
MSDTQTRLDVTSREFLEAWLVGADFPMAATVKLLLGAHDARVAELERVTAARDQFAWIAREAGGDCDPGRIIRACENAMDALAGAARAVQEEEGI